MRFWKFVPTRSSQRWKSLFMVTCRTSATNMLPVAPLSSKVEETTFCAASLSTNVSDGLQVQRFKVESLRKEGSNSIDFVLTVHMFCVRKEAWDAMCAPDQSTLKVVAPLQVLLIMLQWRPHHLHGCKATASYCALIF